MVTVTSAKIDLAGHRCRKGCSIPRKLIPGISALWIVHFTITDIGIVEKRLQAVLLRT